MKLTTYIIVMALVGLIFVIVHYTMRNYEKEQKVVFDTFDGYKMHIHSIKDKDTLFLYYKGNGGSYTEFYSTQNLTKFKK